MIQNRFQKKIGDTLREERMQRKITLDDLESNLRIRREYLKALEKSDYDKLPSEVYVKGFIKNYAKFVGFDQNKAISFYKREHETSGVSLRSEDTTKGSDLKKGNYHFLLRPKNIFIVLFGIVIVSLIIYLGSDFKSFFEKPTLVVESPFFVDASQSNIHKYDTNSEYIDLEGRIGVGNSLKINDMQLDTLGFDTFEIEDLKLESGENEYILQTSNQFGVKNSLKVIVIKGVDEE